MRFTGLVSSRMAAGYTTVGVRSLLSLFQWCTTITKPQKILPSCRAIYQPWRPNTLSGWPTEPSAYTGMTSHIYSTDTHPASTLLGDPILNVHSWNYFFLISNSIQLMLLLKLYRAEIISLFFRIVYNWSYLTSWFF